MMPFMIGILILFFLSMISVNSVSAVRKLRTYTIYRVCGMPWGKCLSIAAYKSLLITAAAGILCGLLMLLKDGSICSATSWFPSVGCRGCSACCSFC